MAKVEKLSDDNLLAVFCLLSLEDIGRCSCVCKRWEKVIRQADAALWKPLYLSLVHGQAQQSKSAKDCLSAITPAEELHRTLLRAYLNSWNSEDHSKNLRITEDVYIIRRDPVAQSSDLARSKRGFSRGQHSWMVRWPNQAGSEAVLGVATKAACKQCAGYVALLGRDNTGWGWHLGQHRLHHNDTLLCKYPRPGTKGEVQKVFSPSADWITVNLDMDRGILWYERDNKFLGIAFDNLPTSEPLYPAFSAVFGYTTVPMVYRGSPVLG